jgi:hypothetical protein
MATKCCGILEAMCYPLTSVFETTEKRIDRIISAGSLRRNDGMRRRIASKLRGKDL